MRGACHAHAHDFTRARALLRYDDASKPLILGFKYGDRLDQAPAFARWLERTGQPLLSETDLTCPARRLCSSANGPRPAKAR